LHSRRFAGMGAVLRSNPDSDYESNILWRHDGFCWDLYAVNNGAVYFYGKGAPLLPRFGAYWSEQYGGAWMMELPFGNRVEFDGANNGCFGSTTHFAALGYLADSVGGITDAGDWQRKVLFSKDLDRDDPVYLLVRDDVSRPNTASSLNWWFMTSNVAPNGLKKPGVVPIKISDAAWIANLGHNWKEAPHLTGQYHHFPGMTGVDVDLFIATPQAPVITTDAASTGQFPYCAGGSDLFETQELVRIAQPAGAGYLSLLVPRWPNSATPLYRTIADGSGVAISAPAGQPRREDRLFLGDKTVSYHDEVVDFNGRAGFVRHGTGDSLRLMVTAGTISADGVRLRAAASAALLLRGGRLQVFYSGDRSGVQVELPAALANSPRAYTAADWFEALPPAINAKP
jgi:hypothetical protein